MNKLIVSKSVFLDVLKYINVKTKNKIDVKTENGIICFGNTPLRLNCFTNKDFIAPLYKKTIENLIKILSLMDEQPITIQIEDSELFNVKICEAYA